MKKRPTKSERNQKSEAAEREAWEAFRPRLEALQSNEGARMLVAEAPMPDSPGRRYYSNLGFFLGGFTVPGGSSYAEKSLYLQLIKRFDAAGELKPGACDQIERALRSAMKAQGPQ